MEVEAAHRRLHVGQFITGAPRKVTTICRSRTGPLRRFGHTLFLCVPARAHWLLFEMTRILAERKLVAFDFSCFATHRFIAKVLALAITDS